MRHAGLAPLLFGLVAGGAIAQTPPSSGAQTAPDIVVTGRSALTEQEALAFTRSISTRIDRQLARLGVPACPRAIGFPAPIAAEIEARIRVVAAHVKIPVGKPDCRGNLVVIGVDDGAGLVRALQKTRSPLLFGLPSSEVSQLRELVSPARAWSLVELQNEDGVPGLTPVGALWANLEVRRASYIAPPTQQSIQFAVVVVEWPALPGKTTVQIADYVAMRTFARTRPPGGSDKVGTILSLFEPDHVPPPSITRTDLAYLRALYARPGPQYARQQIRDIAQGMKKAGR
ncbi:MAG: hypothetical protein PGN21_06415 [Sphingomonas paucimobilis]